MDHARQCAQADLVLHGDGHLAVMTVFLKEKDVLSGLEIQTAR